MNEDASQRLAHWVHWILLAGVWVSGLLLAGGLLLFFLHGQELAPDAASRSAAAINLQNIEEGTGLIQIGLLILIATPMVRVLVLAVGWTLTKKIRFALVAWTVLVLLSVGIILGVSH